MPNYTAASSILTFPLEVLRHSLASVRAFQVWVGLDPEEGTDEERITAAKEHIFLQGLPHPEGSDESYSREQLEAIFPCVILWLESFADATDANGDGFEYGHDSGSIQSCFYQLITAGEEQPGETDRLFLNTIGSILRSNDADDPGLCELSGKAGYFAFTRHSNQGCYRSTDDPAEQANPTGDPPTVRLPVLFEWGAAR